MTERSDSRLDATGLTKIYGGASSAGGGIHGIAFSLEAGTFFTLLGPSGCGKTTTLRCIAGLEQPDDGSIKLGGTFLFDRASKVNVPLNRRHIGMVFQSYAIWPHMTVFENVAFPLRVSRDQSYSASEITKRVGEALETVDMSAYISRSATQLSGGQQQRVALARAIVGQPKLLLLDEPLSNLDARLRDEMRNELKRLQRHIGITTVYVTHDQSEALEMSDRIAIINRGRAIQIATPREIYFRPRDAFVAGFMGSVNLLAGEVAENVSDGEIAEVRLVEGQAVRARFPYALPGPGHVMVSVRPEIVALRPLSDQPADGVNRLLATVLSCGFLGHINRYTLRMGDSVLQANAGSDVEFAQGDAVAVEFSIDNTVGLAPAEGQAT